MGCLDIGADSWGPDSTCQQVEMSAGAAYQRQQRPLGRQTLAERRHVVHATGS